VRKDTKKTIHHLPCVRYKVTSFAIFRPGGLGLTQRFDHTRVMNVTDYCDNIIYTIQITQGLCPQPLTLRVRGFKPRSTDVTHLRYLDGGIVTTQNLGAFCLADVDRTAREFDEYIERNAFHGLETAVRESDGVVRDVLGMIRSHCDLLTVRTPHFGIDGSVVDILKEACGECKCANRQRLQEKP